MMKRNYILSINDYKPDIIMNLAAETHVDRSITNADKFIQTNICGTYNLLNIAYKYWLKLSLKRQKNLDFIIFQLMKSLEVYQKMASFLKTIPIIPVLLIPLQKHLQII